MQIFSQTIKVAVKQYISMNINHDLNGRLECVLVLCVLVNARREIRLVVLSELVQTFLIILSAYEYMVFSMPS